MDRDFILPVGGRDGGAGLAAGHLYLHGSKKKYHVLRRTSLPSTQLMSTFRVVSVLCYVDDIRWIERKPPRDPVIYTSTPLAYPETRVGAVSWGETEGETECGKEKRGLTLLLSLGKCALVVW